MNSGARKLRKDIWCYVRDNPHCSPSEIAEGLDALHSSVRRTLQRLTWQEFVQGIGKSHSRRYVVVGDREPSERVSRDHQMAPRVRVILPERCWLEVFWQRADDDRDWSWMWRVR